MSRSAREGAERAPSEDGDGVAQRADEVLLAEGLSVLSDGSLVPVTGLQLVEGA